MPRPLALINVQVATSMGKCEPDADRCIVARWPSQAVLLRPMGGRRRLGHVIGLVSSTLWAPCHILRRPYNFAAKLAKRSFWGSGVCLRRNNWPRVLLCDFFARFANLSPKTAGLEDCERLLTHLRNKKAIAEMYVARHLLGIRKDLDNGKPGNVSWSPAPELPADGLTRVGSAVAPFSRLPQSGPFRPGAPRPLRGVVFVGKTSA